MVDVLFRRASYEDPTLKEVVFEILEATGAGAIQTGSQILIKPNLLLPAAPSQAITTHPAIVRAVVEYVIEKGGRPIISDSPGMGSFRKIMIRGGYAEALEGLKVNFKPFEASVKVDIGEPFGEIDMAKEVFESEMVINLAKLKTHTKMLLTLGVKNLFGCIIGLRKPEWHLRAGTDRKMFARLLVQIYQAIRPEITIVDGVLALEGQGPGKSGTPRELSLIIGSKDAIAVDMAITSVLGLDPLSLYTNKMAKEMNVYPQAININGHFNILNDFDFPDIGPMSLGPDYLQRFVRKYVLQKPVANNKMCKLCGECWNYCPVKAIDHNIKGIKYDYNACIRCYCCLEICPHGAIRMKEPLLGKVIRKTMSDNASLED
jgi:uncharacterized protein (DUF362 family)/Pyruvate/2-oxoacid:ferredoxin oxidoreductase delta subunit